MYEFVDRPVTGLNHGGRFLVWSMRTWVGAAGAKTCPGSRLAPAFSHWNMLAGLQPFLRMMALFSVHGLSDIGFCGLHCNHISEHEALIMSLVCSLRDGRPERLQETLALLVDGEGIGDLIGALSSLGRAMDAAGIYPDRPFIDHLSN